MLDLGPLQTLSCEMHAACGSFEAERGSLASKHQTHVLDPFTTHGIHRISLFKLLRPRRMGNLLTAMIRIR